MKKYTLAICQDTHPVNLNKTEFSPLGLNKYTKAMKENFDTKVDSIEEVKKNGRRQFEVWVYPLPTAHFV